MMIISTPAPPGPLVLEQAHSWLRTLHVSFVPAESTPLLDATLANLQRAFDRLGHVVQETPTDDTDVIFTTARFGQPMSWRNCLSLQARRRFRLSRSPTIITLLHVRPAQWAELEAQIVQALAKEPPDPADFRFPGLAPAAYRTLVEQGRRGGPVLAIERLLQVQAMCLRLVVIIGDDHPQCAYHFDLVGSLARSEAAEPALYDDIALRAATAVCAEEVGPCAVVPPPIERVTWQGLSAPAAMRAASLELERRGFFTEMVRIADLVYVPAVSDAVADQYSEGCFATWEPALPALISTITGSARPVNKGNITDDDLAVIVGANPEANSVYVRHVKGKRNDRPSSEAFEMADMDSVLPRVRLNPEWGIADPVPVVRSKLHGHRGVAVYDPRHVEYVPMETVYFRYPVTCGTQQQARGIVNAFARAETLRNPDDARQIAFTLLPTHGVFIVEKWVAGKAPFQLLWEAMDAGHLEIEAAVPQGPEPFQPQTR